MVNIERIIQINEYMANHIIDDDLVDEFGHVTLRNKNNYKSSDIIASIFEDHFDDYYAKFKSTLDLKRINAYDEVKKVIDCYNNNLGADIYTCPKCDEIYFRGYTCKSRLCSSCGIKTQAKISEEILQHCYNVKHRQIVFTIPSELREYFKDYNLISIFFDAVSDTIYSIANGNIPKKRKQKIKWMPGFFAFLHTFGRGLNWNPHIHIILAEMKLSKDKINEKWNYFNYDALSKRFQKILLDKMINYLGPSFKYEINKSYHKHKKGFYVYAEPKKFNSLIDGIMYCSRYGSRPCIGENRIKNYDGYIVTYFYNDHKDNEYHEVSLSAFDFITTILLHLPPKNFKIIRYYGFYNKKHSLHDKIKLLISIEKRKIRKEFLKWEVLISKCFNRSPLFCPKCGFKMTFQFGIT